MPAQDLELLQGTLDTLVLKSLTWGPRHGYAVASWIRETTDEELEVIGLSAARSAALAWHSISHACVPVIC